MSPHRPGAGEEERIHTRVTTRRPARPARAAVRALHPRSLALPPSSADRTTEALAGRRKSATLSTGPVTPAGHRVPSQPAVCVRPVPSPPFPPSHSRWPHAARPPLTAERRSVPPPHQRKSSASFGRPAQTAAGASPPAASAPQPPPRAWPSPPPGHTARARAAAPPAWVGGATAVAGTPATVRAPSQLGRRRQRGRWPQRGRRRRRGQPRGRDGRWGGGWTAPTPPPGWPHHPRSGRAAAGCPSPRRPTPATCPARRSQPRWRRPSLAPSPLSPPPTMPTQAAGADPPQRWRWRVVSAGAPWPAPFPWSIGHGILSHAHSPAASPPPTAYPLRRF